MRAAKLLCLQLLIDEHCLASARDMHGLSHLHWMVRFNHSHLFQRLLAAWPSTDIAVTDKYSKSVLVHAIVYRSLDVISVLFELPRDSVQLLMDTPNKYRQYPIHVAARRDETVGVLQQLVEAGDDPSRRQAGQPHGAPPLQLAARACALKPIDYLLSLPQVNINMTSEHSLTALIHVVIAYCYHSRANVMRAKKKAARPFLTAIHRLLAANIDMDVSTSYGIFRTTKHENRRQTALEIAVKGGLLDAVKLLAEAGASVDHGLLQQADDQLSRYLAKNANILEWLKHFYSSPQPLKNLCRQQVRRTLAHRFRFTVSLLPIPSSLIGYLSLNDLQHYTAKDDHAKPNEATVPAADASNYEYESSAYDSDEHLDPLAGTAH